MERGDDLRTDPIEPSPDSPPPPPPPDSPPPPPPPPPRPPEPEGDPPSPDSYSTPESLLAWAAGKLSNLKTGLYVLLGNFGFLDVGTLENFKKHERSAGAKALNDKWIDSLWSSRGPSTASGSNVASLSQASSSMGESSMAFDPNGPSTSKKQALTGESSITFGSNVPPTSQESSWMGESSMAFDPNVPSTSQACSWMSESSMDLDPNVPSTSHASLCSDESSIDFDPNVPSTSHASSCSGESSVDESSMDLESNLASTSQASSRKRKHPSLTSNPPSDYDDAAIGIGMDFVLHSTPLLKGINDFCAKYLRHNEVSEQIKDTLFDMETCFVIKRKKKVLKTFGRINVERYMRLWVGIRELRYLAEKISRDQKTLCNKMYYIMRRRARLDQLFSEDHSVLSSMARKDNNISYSMYWIYKNLVFIDKIMLKKRKMHILFEVVRRKVQQQLSSY